jgi:hypothetical protein
MYFLNPFYLGSPLKGGYNVSGHWGYHEMATYIGIIPFFLAVGSLWAVRRRPVIAWFWILAVLFSLLAMGDSTALSHQVFKFFYDFLPGFGHNRSVGRIMLLTMFCLSCAAGLALEEWTCFWEKKKIKSRPARIFLTAVIPLLLAGITVADLGRYGQDFISTRPVSGYFSRSSIFPEPVLDQIQADKSLPRVQPGSENGYEQILRVYQLATSTMFTLVIKEVAQYVHAVQDHYDSPLSDLIGLKYVEHREFFQKPTDRWKPLAQGTVVNVKALPRAFVVGGYDLAADSTKAVQTLQNVNFDIRSGILLEKDPVEKTEWKKGWIGAAAITNYGTEEVEMTCQTDRTSFLFFSDPYYPGWKAWVDGKEKPVLRADGAFRAVVLDGPGSHQVRMAFRPLSIYLPFCFSGILWMALVLGFIFPVKTRRCFKGPARWMGFGD